ncbi:MAG: lysoplasmalogenase [Anaerolineaceae bacterium]|nr:lysoplasmalogenase [Anaerolineaceae bacterium]
MILRSAFLWLALGLALAEWVAVWRHARTIRWLTKPATMLALIAWFTHNGGWQGAGVWFGLGLTLSMAGDVLLLLPPRFFRGGLVFFLAAHLCYLVGFNTALPALGWESFLTVAVVTTAGVLLAGILQRGLRSKPETSRLAPWVLAYSFVISAMLLSALLCFWREGWSQQAAALASLGAFLFYFSDLLLAMHRFIRPLPAGDFGVMVAYFLAQFGIATAALLAFAR